MSEHYPATGEQIVAWFRTYDHDKMWSENWTQGPNEPLHDPQIPDTTTTIQGVLCCVDRDNTIAWLMMLCDSPADTAEGWIVSYICMTYGGDGPWPWAWITADDDLHACREFLTWLELNDDYDRLRALSPYSKRHDEEVSR